MTSVSRVRDLVTVRQGKTPSKAVSEYWGPGVPWASSRDIKAPRLTSTLASITPEAVRDANVPVAPIGALFLVNRSGVLVHTLPLAQVVMPAAFNQDITCLDPDRCRVLPSWLRLFVKSREAQILARGVKTGSTVPSVEVQFVLDMAVRVPSLTEQHAVVQVVEDQLLVADAAISDVNEQARLASELERATLRAAFGSPPVVTVERTAGHPAGWTRQPLMKIARLESGHTPSRRQPEWWGGDVPWLALPDIRKLHGAVAFETTEYTNDLGLANSSARLLPAGTVCLCRDASIGFVTMLGRPMATSQHFCNWICDAQKLDPEFLMYAFMASFDHLRELGSGSVLKTIYMPTIEAFHLCAPPLPEQQRIAQRLRGQLAAARALRDRLAERQQEIERLPQRILAAAFGDAV